MTPYWPSPLGATHRRLNPNAGGQLSFTSRDSFRSPPPVQHRFPKPDRGIRWVAEADLPAPDDFEFGPDGRMPEAG